ncbi:MAG: amidohydrolase [Gammaproteobacteria bacterium]|nr:amidohydrolase [Gammaproteobacteria bacterium]
MACMPQADQDKQTKKKLLKPFASTYKPMDSVTTLLTNATILTGTGERLNNASILIADNRIVELGQAIKAPASTMIIDAKGRWITPGLIDNHSHLGVYPSPSVKSTSDGNEVTAPDTANVWAEHSVWPQDPGFNYARAGGVTSIQILPGSANLFGGRGVALKNIPASSMMAMKFPNAPHSLKMACGENPKRVYGKKGVSPATRMGNMAGYRKSWIEATNYREQWDAYNKAVAKGHDAEKPERDLRLETLAEVLRGNINIHNHCYRADEMLQMIALSKEFNYKIASFHHAVESYKIADALAEEGICSSMWSDWWGFKLEAYDGIKENIPMVDQAGACAIVHSDSSIGIQHLNQDAAKAMASGNKAGFEITEQHAISWITSNSAKSMGIFDQTGSLEKGKMADLVLWSGNPFSVYTKADQVYIDGALVFDRNNANKQAVSDYKLGLVREGAAQ